MAYRYKNVCSSDQSVLVEAIKSSYPMFLNDGVAYLPVDVHFTFSENLVIFKYDKRLYSGDYEFNNQQSFYLSNCENIGVFDNVMPVDFGVIVFLVLSFLLGLALGARGHG